MGSSPIARTLLAVLGTWWVCVWERSREVVKQLHADVSEQTLNSLTSYTYHEPRIHFTYALANTRVARNARLKILVRCGRQQARTASAHIYGMYVWACLVGLEAFLRQGCRG